MRLTIVFFLVLSFHASWSHLEINEIMYFPADSNEWIEIFNPHNYSIDISEFFIQDNFEKDNIICCPFLEICSFLSENNSYLLITDLDTTLYNSSNFSSLKLCVEDNSIGNGLGNTGDTITISNGTEGDTFNYTNSLGGNGNNKTLERRQDHSWAESLIAGGTPNQKNSIWDITSNYQQLEITEFLPDPFGSDGEKKPAGEWLELHNNGSNPLDLSELYFEDQKHTAKLYIADTNTDPQGTTICSNCYKVIYRDGDTDFSLNNDYDHVFLIFNNSIIDSVSYAKSTEGMSWSKSSEGWVTTTVTPGQKNNYTPGCDWTIKIITSPLMINSSEFTFTVNTERKVGSPLNLTTRGIILNQQQQIIKEYAPWTDKFITTFSETTYSPSLDEGLYELHFWIENLSCSDTNNQNNNASILVAIVSKNISAASIILIEELITGSKENIPWGDSLNVKLHIYKGNETKDTLTFWAEKDHLLISEKTKLSLKSNFQNYFLTIPLQLDSNCDKKLNDGIATLFIDGFATANATFKIGNINEGACQEINNNQQKKVESKKSSPKEENIIFVDLPSVLHSGEVHRTKVQVFNNNKKQKYSLYTYLYKGKTCYSCHNQTEEKRHNLQEFLLEEKETTIREFLLKIDSSLEEGEYKIKAILQKEGHKTPLEETKTIYLQQLKPSLSVFSQNSSFLLSSNLPENIQKTITKSLFPATALDSQRQSVVEQSPGIVVYESNAQRTKRLIPYFLITTLSLFIIILLANKKTI